MSGLIAQIGFADETTYNTAVAATNYFEFTKESIVPKYERIESSALRSNTRIQRSDRWAPNAKGADGDIEVEVLSKGFDFWLKHMLGTVSSTAVAPITHTATVGPLVGKSFTCEIGRPQTDSVLQKFTYGGGKVTEWELSNAVDGILMANFSCLFSGEAMGGTLGTPTYPASTELLTYVGGLVKFGGTGVDVKDISIKGSNALADDRYFIRNSGQRKEPVENGFREYTVEMTFDFTEIAQYQRMASTTAAGATVDFNAKWTAPNGASLEVQVPTLRIDEASVNVDGPELLEQKVTAKILDSGSASPITIVYAPNA